MKKIVLALLCVNFVSCNQSGSKGSKKVSLNTEEDKIFYSMGVMMGRSLTRLALTEKEMTVLKSGLHDSASGKGVQIKDEELMQYQPKIQNLFRSRNEGLAKGNKEAGAKYINTFKKEAGVKVTDSGIAYKVIKEGTGKSPSATETVEVHYHGTLIDGTVFDSSKDRGKTAQFPLNQVIKGWTEGLQLMKEGGETRFVIPSDLAYGDAGRPPKIPAGATLIFDVELKKIGPAAPAAAHSADDGHGHGAHGSAQELKAKMEAAAAKAKDGSKKIIKEGQAALEKIKSKTK